ncbi:hypothetical protein MRX96_035667 [Rhipicephalus microplus]
MAAPQNSSLGLPAAGSRDYSRRRRSRSDGHRALGSRHRLLLLDPGERGSRAALWCVGVVRHKSLFRGPDVRAFPFWACTAALLVGAVLLAATICLAASSNWMLLASAVREARTSSAGRIETTTTSRPVAVTDHRRGLMFHRHDAKDLSGRVHATNRGRSQRPLSTDVSAGSPGSGVPVGSDEAQGPSSPREHASKHIMQLNEEITGTTKRNNRLYVTLWYIIPSELLMPSVARVMVNHDWCHEKAAVSRTLEFAATGAFRPTYPVPTIC